MDSAGCNSSMAGIVSCKAARCGDGYANMVAGERCDSSGMDRAQCNGRICTLPSCGDDYVNVAAGEQCESSGKDTAACNGPSAGAISCHFPSCGDGYVNTQFTPAGGARRPSSVTIQAAMTRINAMITTKGSIVLEVAGAPHVAMAM